MTKGITYAIIGSYVDKGMKSKGSKSLIEFNNQKLLDYQINQIKTAHKNLLIDYEILYITNFEYAKIEKLFKNKIKIFQLDEEKNPVFNACELAKYKKIFFIDYGCVFESSLILKLIKKNKSIILGCQCNSLDIGIFVEKPDLVINLFYDLSDNKFSNMFLLCEDHVLKLLNSRTTHRNNLLYFEILNFLIENSNSEKLYHHPVKPFFYFNHMRQKYGISKFIKKYS